MPVKELPIYTEWQQRADGETAWISVGDPDKGPHFQCDFIGDMERGPISYGDFACDLCDIPQWVIDGLELGQPSFPGFD
jgi:hypothetical protein